METFSQQQNRPTEMLIPRKGLRYLTPIGIVAGILVLLSVSVFQVDATEYAIVTQFGNPVRALTSPGLYKKLPDPIQSITRLDSRMQVLSTDEGEFLTKDKKNILVEAYATWKIDDPVLFYKSVTDVTGATTRLTDIITSELGVALGQYDLSQLVSTKPEDIQLQKLLETLTTQADSRTKAYGFTIIDVRIKQLNFPEANRESVFQRMRAERQQIARQLRSEGTEEATKIRAAADAEKTTILSKAQEEASAIKGSGEAEAIRIYAQAFGKDPEFYKFIRTLESYDKIITDGTTLIVPSDSELLKYLNPQ